MTIASLMTPAAAQAAQSQQVGSHSVQAVKKAQGLWIDVRSPEEFQQGHIEGAQNIPVDRIASEISRISPDKNAPLNLYCRSGRRSEVALQTLKKLGYTHVINRGGYQDLLDKGIH
ncbi:MAG: rhodanese-like domain-containing protein [Neisseria sp.]|uniref:rhodanese-like domain-containing protein n=1 Tax=Neisseria sp. TaxID=192066 RepID=UPI0026DC5DDB|nr:rhodanese-like domain-containing protein [Neisseria sp.]MDO4641679.1 rhodanese-like domain-containing protein [Neisseria sp.]